MSRNNVLTGLVESIAPGGAGLVRLEGVNHFVELSAPGDLVRFKVLEDHKGWSRSETLEVIHPSPQRSPPLCTYYGRCGGCSLQHLSYESQIEAKTGILMEAFRRIGGMEISRPRARPSPPFEYRNRMQFHFMRPELSLGFVERRSSGGKNRLIAIGDCPVAYPLIRAALKNGGLKPPPEKDRFTVYGRGDLLLSEGGKRRGTLMLRDRELRLDAGIFFQSNGEMTEALIGELLDIAAAADRSLPMADIYCGVGTFGAFLSEYFSRADLVEENKNALALARENVGGEGRFFALSDRAWVRAQEKEPAAYGFVVADPPREGLSPPLRTWLLRRGPPLLAYVSCDPATLARDSRELISAYTLDRLEWYDFYPQTAHIESLALFRRR